MAKWSCFAVATILLCVALAHAVEAARDTPAAVSGAATAPLPASAKTASDVAGVAEKKSFWTWGGDSGPRCDCGSSGGGVGPPGGIGGGDALAAVSGVGTATLPASTKTASAVAGVADKKSFWSWGGDSGSRCDCGSSGGVVGPIGGIGGGDTPVAISATLPAYAKTASAVAGVADKKSFWSWGGDSGSRCDCRSSGGGVGPIGGIGGGDAPAVVSGVAMATLPASANTASAVASMADKKSFWSWGGDSGPRCDCGSSGDGVGPIGGGGDGGH